MAKVVDLNLPPPMEEEEEGEEATVTDLNLPLPFEEYEEQPDVLMETLHSVPLPSPDYLLNPPQIPDSLRPPMIFLEEDYAFSHQPYTDVSSPGSINFFPQNYPSNEIGLDNLGLDVARPDDSFDSLMFDVFGDEWFEEGEGEAIGMMDDDDDGEEIILANERRQEEDYDLNLVHHFFYTDNAQFEAEFDGGLFVVEDDDEDYPSVGNPSDTYFIETLPSIILSQEHIEKNNICAVCTDEFFTKEKVTLLPCSHYFHGNCILPWLNIRNTCPVCRYEFPVEDPVLASSRYNLNLPL